MRCAIPPIAKALLNAVPFGLRDLSPGIGDVDGNNRHEFDILTNGEQCLVRMQNVPRKQLVAPYQVAGSLGLSRLTGPRVTHGQLNDGRACVVQGNWRSKGDASSDMGQFWIGRADFILRLDDWCIVVGSILGVTRQKHHIEIVPASTHPVVSSDCALVAKEAKI